MAKYGDLNHGPGEFPFKEKGPRPTTLSVLMDTAKLWAKRSTCDRLHVGCVIAKDGRIIATGYNGAPPGVEHCNHDCDCNPHQVMSLPELMHQPDCNSQQPCKIAVHAEANAICFAARHGLSLNGCTVYTTHAPCFNCSLLLMNTGVKAVIYDRPFRDMSGPEFLFKNGVQCGAFKRHPSDDIIER